MKSKLSLWERERAGFILLGAAFLCVFAISAMLGWAERSTLISGQRAELGTLARFLANSVGPELINPATRAATLRQIWQIQENRDLSYVALTDTQGRLLSDMRSPGDEIPAAPSPREAHSWSGDRELVTNSGPIIDFHAPILIKAELAGFLRMGVGVPAWKPYPENIQFVSMLAIPVLLLGGLGWLLYRREFTAFSLMRAQMETLEDSSRFSAVVDEPRGGESAKLHQRLAQLLATESAQLQQLRERCDDLEVNTRIAGFRRARVEGVLEAIPSALLVMDETGVCTFANVKLENLLGVIPEQIVGKKTQEWCDDPQILEFIVSADRKAIAAQSSNELRFSPQNAPEKSISLKAFPLYSPTQPDQIFGKVVVFHDATAEVLAKGNESDFVGHISHELKTPLNVLAMYSEELLEEGDDEAFRVEAVNVIRDEVDRLALMINNLLNITQFEMGSLALDRQRVRLHELLQDCFDSISRSGKGQDLNFEFNVPKEMSPIFVDKDLLRIAINNLLTNAIKYNRANGTVELSAEEDEQTIRIVVRDTGIGIDPKDWQKIFDKFYRSENEEVQKRSGHGLGLPLAMQIVQLHHGKIDIDSQLNVGTKFIITFNKQAGILRRADEK